MTTNIIYNMEKDNLSPNEEISKKYILENKESYPRETLLLGLTNHGIEQKEAQSYIEKYYKNQRSEFNHTDKKLKDFFTGIYTRMFLGLFVTFISVGLLYLTDLYYLVYGSSIIYYGFVAIQIAVLLGSQVIVNKVSPNFFGVLFYLYSIITAIVIGGIFLIYDLASIVTIFLVATSMFALLAIIGKIIKKDLSSMGKILIVGMWGIFFASLINIWLGISGFDFIISIIAVIVFAGLTVYDQQLFKNIFHSIKTKEDFKRYQNLGALFMYVNFIMIFINLLKIFGDRE